MLAAATAFAVLAMVALPVSAACGTPRACDAENGWVSSADNEAPPARAIGADPSRVWADTATRELQRALNRHGASLVVDGIRGDATDAALRLFQSTNDLKVDGVAGSATWGVLNGEAAPPNAVAADPTVAFGWKLPPSGTTVLKLGHKGETVAEAQGLLNLYMMAVGDEGAEVDADGYYGEMTVSIVEQVQRLAGIDVDGRFGPDTRAVVERWAEIDTPNPYATERPPPPPPPPPPVILEGNSLYFSRAGTELLAQGDLIVNDFSWLDSGPVPRLPGGMNLPLTIVTGTIKIRTALPEWQVRRINDRGECVRVDMGPFWDAGDDLEAMDVSDVEPFTDRNCR